jgi:uncharacterized membrane protein
MAKVVRSVTINVPVEKVFNYFDDPSNLPEIWPSLMEINDVKRTPEGVGSTHGWVYKLAGKRIQGTAEIIKYVVNKRIVSKAFGGGIESTQTYTFESMNGGTKFTCENVYTIDIPILGKLAEAFVAKLNENEADVFMANLKARMET